MQEWMINPANHAALPLKKHLAAQNEGFSATRKGNGIAIFVNMW